MEVRDIDLKEIRISSLNTRRNLAAGSEEVDIDDLADSIREKGLLSPVTVIKKSDDEFELIAGQRRYLACMRLGWRTIPAIVREVTDDTDATVISLIENVQRQDIAPIDKARAYSSILGKYGEYDRVAKETGVSVQTIRKYLSLLKLDDAIQDELTTKDGPIGISAMAKLAETFSKEDQMEAWTKTKGFKQQIQLDILRGSNGDIGRLDELVDQAVDGKLDRHICKGFEDCQFIPKELIGKICDEIQKHEMNSEKRP
ncbi:MAG: ParB/RepB/Spo0J family partition protein [Thermoplasmata archaeon]|nr:ParB/RepB/Spo0J family partition protein [Thermoplasmata archaeon]